MLAMFTIWVEVLRAVLVHNILKFKWKVRCGVTYGPVINYDCILPHKVKTHYLHFRFHANCFLLPWQIPEEISRRLSDLR